MARGELGDPAHDGLDLGDGAAPVNVIGSATSDASWASVRPRRGSAASRAKTSLSAWPWRMSRAAPTAASLIASCAVSRPTPLRTAAISTLVVDEERQVAVELALDHRREGAELVEHGQERLEQPVGGEEGVRQGDPAYDGAETSPSFHWSPASSPIIDR